MQSQSTLSEPDSKGKATAAASGAPPRRADDDRTAEMAGLLVKALRALPPQHLREVLGALGAEVLREALDALAADAEDAPEQKKTEPEAPNQDNADAKEGEPGQSERRCGPRERTLRGGKIIFNDRMSVIDCRVVDISDRGCRIKGIDTATVPEHFTLRILAGDSERQCTVVWRKPDQLGVHFVD